MKKLLLFTVITFLFQFSNAQNSWGIVGSATPNGWFGPDVEMTYNADLDVWWANILFQDYVQEGLEIKFRKNNEWVDEYGDNNSDGFLDFKGANIPVSEGDFFVELNLNELTYQIENSLIPIEDPIFEQALIAAGIDSNGETGNVLLSDVKFITFLDVTDKGISDLTGIEAFVNLEGLEAGGNNLTAIDISNNTKLKEFHINGSSVTSIDFSHNLLLEGVGLNGNDLSAINLSKQPNLKGLAFNDNLNLEKVNVRNGNNINMEYFLGQNVPNLSCITVDDETADFSAWNTDPTISFSNSCGGYVNIPDENFEQALIDLEIDSDGVINHSISREDAECATELVLNFPIAQDSQGNDIPNTFADERLTITEKITDLTGIDAFTNITLLGVGYHELTTIDLSNNLLLDDLFLNDNQFSTIDISNNTLLARFGIMRNALTENIDFSQNTLLQELFLDDTGISAIDLSSHTDLWKLIARNNNVSTIDVSSNTNLSELRVGNNQLTTLDVSSNLSLQRLDVDYNYGLSVVFPSTEFAALTSLNLSGTGLTSFTGVLQPNLEWLLLNDNALTNFDGASIPNLKNLFIQRNQLNVIDVSNNPALGRLECESNQLNEINLTNNSLLKVLGCSNNNLSKLDLSNNLLLENIWCPDNNLTNLNLELNSQLNVYGLYNNPLIYVSVKNGNNHNMKWFDARNLPNLTCLTVDDETAEYLNGWNWNVDETLSFSDDCGGFVHIPDPNFEQALIDIGVDSDGVVNSSILRSDAEAVTSLNLNIPLFTPENYNFKNLDIINVQEKIADLTGIEAFINLTNLQASYSDLETVNVSNNIQLQELWISDSQLTGIDISSNTNLLRFGVMRNNIVSTIDVSQNTQLEWLLLSDNSIPSLDVSTNLNIQRLDVQNNSDISVTYPIEELLSLTYLNVSGINLNSLSTAQFPNLNTLYVQGSQLNVIDVSNNPVLERLECEQNQLEEIDVSNNPLLKILGCSNNNLSKLDLSNNLLLENIWCPDNNLTGLNLELNSQLNVYGLYNNPLIYVSIKNGNNQNIIYSDMHNLPSLSCISVDDESADNSNLNLDPGVLISNDCGTIYIPDENFEQALIDLEIDTDGEINHLISKVDSESATELVLNFPIAQDSQGNDIPNTFADERLTITEKITDLTGIQAFTNITLLGVGYHELTTIDLSNNLLLDDLFLNDNQFTTIDISNNTLLTRFGIMRNALTENIDFSQNTLLQELFLDDTGISAIDLSLHTDLWKLVAANNNLSTIDVSSNINLSDLRVTNNQLIALDVSSNVNLVILAAGRNQIVGTIDLQNLSALETLYVQANSTINSLDISNNTQLKVLWASWNELTSLNLENNLGLEELWIHNNNINSIDVTKNSFLTKLSVRNNGLNELNLVNNTSLTRVDANGNNFVSLDFSNQPIDKLSIYDNPLLEHVDLRNGNNVNIIYFNASNTNNLSCINADEVISQAMIDSGKTFEIDCGDFVYIPDPNFEQALIDIGIDSDGIVNSSILRSDAEATIELNVSNPLFTSDDRYDNELIVNVNEKIADLTGVEAFVNITKLSCWGGEITSLDLSNNPLLKTVELIDNQISDINITQNTEITLLWLEKNALTNLDISTNTELLNIAVGFNQLTSLDVSNNPKLWAITAEENDLTTIDVSSNLELTALWVYGNSNFNKLDVSKNTLLNSLGILNTSIEVLDLSNNPITRLYASNNPMLTNLDMRNGNNLNIATADLSNTPNLTCVNVDDETADFSIWNTDVGDSFSNDCGDFIYIPDPNFEQALIDIGIDSDGVVNTSILRNDAEAVTDLNLNIPLFTPENYSFDNGAIINVQEKIADLTGIEAFVNLTNLQASYSDLENVDVSYNTQLQELWISDSQLTGIDISSNTNLLRFGVMRNNITNSIDVSQNTQLEWLLISENEIPSLDVSTNLSLQRLDVQYNSNLNLTLPAVELLSLNRLNVSGIGLDRFNATLLPNLEYLFLNDNALTNFNASKIVAIQYLLINNNQLGSLDVSANSLLVNLQAENNQLTDLNIANGANENLSTLRITSNLLTCITADNDVVDLNIAPYNNWMLDVGVQFSLNCKAAPEVVLIPDPNFEQLLIDLGWDTNGEGTINGNILLSEAELITTIDVIGTSVTEILDFTGIESFVNLTSLNIPDVNYSGDLDLNENDKLEFLNCSNNEIDNLLINSCKALINLNASGNNLSILDVSGNGALVDIDVSENSLTSLEISSTRDLTNLNASGNAISEINLEELTALESLDISGNAMQLINVTELDQLSYLDVSDNSLLELDIRNGANTILTTFNSVGNIDLKCIGVDDASNIQGGWLKDVEVIYTTSGDCLDPIVQTNDVTIYLDAKGVASISVSDIDAGSSDNATSTKNLIFSLSKTEFSCGDLGPNEVELTVEDLEGNSTIGFAEVMVEDNIPPVAKAVRSLSFDLADGPVNIVAEDIEDGSTDNCGIPSLSIGDTGGNFTLPGVYYVTLTAIDEAGNESTSETEVEITDSSISTAGLSFGKLKLTVFPVPFSDVINISFSEATDLNTVTAQLFDISQDNTGIDFSANGANLVSENTEGLLVGVYYLVVTIEGKKTQTQSISIIKE